MNRSLVFIHCALTLGAIAGCGSTATVDEPRQTAPVASRRETQTPSSTTAKVTWDTDRDRPFAEFLRDSSGGMVREASVGIENKGRFQVVLDRSVAPEDTLGLTKSLMNGARKDFPDRPITLAVFDPSKTLILKANYRVGQGVSYQVAHDSEAAKTNRLEEPEVAPTTGQPATRSGSTPADRKFAEWAEEHGKSYLRYVEADIERHGRLWFGVTRDVQPDDVPNLTKSLLEGAHKEFPENKLVATVFDPDGEKIGTATLERNGSIDWAR